MNLPKKIITAKEIIYRVFPDCAYIYSDYEKDNKAKKYYKDISKAWDFILNFNDRSIGYRLEFFRKYGFTYEESLLVMFTPPDKGILKLAGFPQDILDRVDEANNFCKEICEDLKEQNNLIEQKQEILNYLEIVALEDEKKIIGEWQGEDTRFIFNNWQEVDQLFDINSITQKHNENKAEKMLKLSLTKRKEWEDTIKALEFENKKECEILYYYFHKEILKEDLGTIELNAPKEIKCSQTKIKNIVKKGLEIVNKYKLPLPLKFEDSE